MRAHSCYFTETTRRRMYCLFELWTSEEKTFQPYWEKKKVETGKME